MVEIEKGRLEVVRCCLPLNHRLIGMSIWYRLSSSRDVFFRIYDIIISEAQEICISGMIMMMLLTMTMKRWPEANLSPDLGRTRQVSGSLRQQMRCFSRPNNPPCSHLISFYQCAMPQIKGKQGTSIWDVYFVWLHKMTGKMSTFEL